jgi:hypothetical protein
MAQTDAMDDLEELRVLVGPVANDWSEAKLRQLARDIDTMAEILLALYYERKRRDKGVPGSFDRSPSDR